MGPESDAKTNLDRLNFGDAFRECRSQGFRLLAWRGHLYDLSKVDDVAEGFDKQAKTERRADQWTPEQLEAIYNMRHVEKVSELEFQRRLRENFVHEPDAPHPPAGRMSSEKPIRLIRIERQDNGGWLVGGGGDRLHYPNSDLSGAFTSTADMLAALTDLLEQDDVKREEGQ
ncbi:hypothetical protein [Roseinatronobacter sp. NSM]|uniref:hypothetical protein n=1 Tax=Roseinatronobacter sp. NSM TaxID=3457785 RepID=UPI004035986D